jgi:hypothetical protein
MPKRISRAIGTTHAALSKQRAFDGFVDVDSKVYVDPHLLEKCEEPEFAESRKKLDAYFRDVLKLLKAAKIEGDIAWREALRRMHFAEVSATGLGHTSKGTRGRAISGKLSLALTRLTKEIINLGIEDPDLFTLLGMIQEGVGSDLISDMTVWIILDDVLSYSARVAEALKVEVTIVEHNEHRYRVPMDETTGRAILLLPKTEVALHCGLTLRMERN